MTTTRTYAILDVSAAAYEEIKERIRIVGATNRIHVTPDDVASPREVIILGDIALRKETDERVKVWIMLEGKRLLATEQPA